MYTITMHIATHLLPLKLMLLRKTVFVIAAIINIFKPIIFNKPLKCLDICYTFAQLKNHMQVIAYDRKACKNGISVIFIKV